jgi:amino acid transporter
MQFVGGELKNPKRSLLYGLVLAEVVSILIWFGLTYVVDNVVGISFIEAWTLTAGGGSGTVPTAFTAVLNSSGVLLWLIVAGLFIGNIGWSWLSLVFISRLFLSWSFDRVIPTGFAHVSDRFHTPTTAILLGAGLAIIPMYLEYFTSFISTQVNAIFLYSVVWFLAAVSAAIFPFARRRIFETAQKSMLGRTPVISILGVLGVVLFAYLGYNSATNSAIGPFASGAQVLTAIVVAIPVVIYAVSYMYNRGRGINLRLLHSEIPPE